MFWPPSYPECLYVIIQFLIWHNAKEKPHNKDCVLAMLVFALWYLIIKNWQKAFEKDINSSLAKQMMRLEYKYNKSVLTLSTSVPSFTNGGIIIEQNGLTSLKP